jgi:hypothetical protein
MVQPMKGTIGSIAQFDRRIARSGTRYRYASIEPDVLGVVLRNSTNRTMSDFLQEKMATDRRRSRRGMAVGCRMGCGNCGRPCPTSSARHNNLW